MRKYVLILGIIILSFGAKAQTNTCGENCTYTLIQNNEDNEHPTYKLTVFPIDADKPAQIGEYSRYGYPQTGTNYAPWRFDTVTEVVIQSGIESIGYGAFTDKSGLTKVTLPEGLKKLGDLAFNSVSITSINLPSTLTSLGEWSLATSTLEEINEIPSAVTSIGRYALAYTKITDLVIPENVDLSPMAFGKGRTNTTLQNLYCKDTIADQCAAAIENIDEDVHIIKYAKEDGLYVLTNENDEKIYYKSGLDMKNNANICSNVNVCKAEILKDKGLCSDINGDCKTLVDSANAGNMLKYNGKTYQSLAALLKGDYDKRRIYTIEEANFVAGKKNRVSIKYR